MAEEKDTTYEDIVSNLKEQYKYACYDKDDEIMIKLPIKRLKETGDYQLKVELKFKEYDTMNYKLIITTNFNHMFRVSVCSTNQLQQSYNVIYKSKMWFENAFCLDEDALHELMMSENELTNENKISNLLNNIDFNELYEYIDNLKWCETTFKLYPNLFNKQYIDKYISNVSECCVCYGDTTHQIKCSHYLCIECCYKIMKTNRSASSCPLCRENIWHKCNHHN